MMANLELKTASCSMLVMALAANLQAASLGEPGRDSDGPNPLNNVDFGEQHRQSVTVTQSLDEDFGMFSAQRFFGLAPDTFGRQRFEFAAVGEIAHQLHGFFCNPEAE